MDEKPCYPIPSCDCADDAKRPSTDMPPAHYTEDVKRSLRDMPPAHYTLEIDSFSDLQKILKVSGGKSYESRTFEVGGYKWKLSLYPNGDEERNGKGHISMYLVIAETEALPLSWEVHVEFKLFVFDHIHNKFWTIEDASERVRRFHRMKTQWGFAQLLPHTQSGFLDAGKCAFGAEIFVISRSVRVECLTPLKNFSSCYTWKICPFSSLTQEYLDSEVFTLADIKWKLKLYPNGDSDGAGKYLSLFLFLEDSEAPTRVYAEFKLTIRDQCNNKDWNETGHRWFSPAERWGWSKCISLIEIKNASKGFAVNDTLIVEAQIIRLSTLQSFSEGSDRT